MRGRTDTTLLEMALTGYEAERQKIEAKIAEIQRQLNRRSGRVAAPVAASGAKPGRKMSAAARKRIAAAQRKRWAEYHKKQQKAA